MMLRVDHGQQRARAHRGHYPIPTIGMFFLLTGVWTGAQQELV